MALLDIGNAWNYDPATDTFKKFLGACLVAANAILNESGSAGNHANRIIWAHAILSQDVVSVLARVQQIIRLAAATNATFQGDPTGQNDGAVQFIVNSLIDTVAVGQ